MDRDFFKIFLDSCTFILYNKMGKNNPNGVYGHEEGNVNILFGGLRPC